MTDLINFVATQGVAKKVKWPRLGDLGMKYKTKNSLIHRTTNLSPNPGLKPSRFNVAEQLLNFSLISSPTTLSRRCGRSRRGNSLRCFHVRLVQLDRLSFMAQPQIKHFHQDGETHRKVNVAFGNV